MNFSSPKLLEPFDLKGLPLKNRVVMGPMTRARAGKSRVPNATMSQYYSQRASTGLIITEATTISKQANGWNESPGIYTDTMMSGWQQVVASVHDAGGKIFLQLWHCGRVSHSSFHDGKLAVAPSAIKVSEGHIRTPDGQKPNETPRALETDEIPALIEDYRSAAKRAKIAGFDGIEIHAAGGYLIDTFLQSQTNHRQDQYGGNPANRYRLLGEVIQAVSEVWPMNRIGVKLSPNVDMNNAASSDFREQFIFVAKQLNSLDLAYLHVMDGLAFGFHELGTPMTLVEFREVFHGVLIGNCGYTQKTAEVAISQGDADLISFGRPFISNPDLVERFTHGWPLHEEADIVVWYSPTGHQGYTDFPNYVPTQPESSQNATGRLS